MIRLLPCLLLLFFCGCGSKDPAPPADTIDALTGTIWVRYGFKSPVNGKDVYYYFTFKKNGQVDSFIRYNKTEPSPDGAETGSYQHGGSGSNPSVMPLMITLKAGTFPAEVSGSRLTFHNPSSDLIYTKE